MSDLFRFNVRTWVLGATAAGFLGQSIIAVGQSGIPAGPNVRKPIIKPRSTPEDRPRLLRVPNDSDVEKATIQPVSQIEVAANQKSEVQRQLEKLYEQDGREMPTDNLNMNMQPLAPANGIPQTTAPAAQPTAPQTHDPWS